MSSFLPRIVYNKIIYLHRKNIHMHTYILIHIHIYKFSSSFFTKNTCLSFNNKYIYKYISSYSHIKYFMTRPFLFIVDIFPQLELFLFTNQSKDHLLTLVITQILVVHMIMMGCCCTRGYISANKLIKFTQDITQGKLSVSARFGS